MNWAIVGTRLAQLGGADPRLLPKVPAARGKFTQMGLVLLSTALLAVVSMSFALIDALKAPWPVAVPLALVWGFVILNLDRLLIQNLSAHGRFWQTVLMVLPRLAIAALLGLVIATPLVVRVFDSEIRAEMTQENAAATAQLGSTRAQSPEAKRLAEVTTKINTDQGIMAGNVPGLTSPNVVAAQQQLASAQATVTTKNKAAQDAYDQMICERDGVRCHNASGKPGEGDRFDALKRLYDVAAADYEEAKQTETTAQQALDTAQKLAAKTNVQALTDAQDRAKAELPALTAERNRLQTAVNTVSAKDSVISDGNTGMLARIEALHRIGQRNSSAKWAHWAVAGLLFMIELLPVLVKLLTGIGPPSLYDRISTLDDNSTIDEATRRRAEDRRRIERESRKQREIAEDMQARETKLGVRGNEHVEREMEKILDAALAEWSVQVQRTLHNRAVPPPRMPVNGGRNGQLPLQPGNSPLNLPPASTL